MNAYQKHKRSCQSSWITRIYVPKRKYKTWVWKIAKKKVTFLPEPTHLAILSSRDGILLLYHLNLRWPCDLLWSTESGGNRVVSALCLSSKKPGTHFTPPLGEGDHQVNNPPVARWRMRTHGEGGSGVQTKGSQVWHRSQPWSRTQPQLLTLIMEKKKKS